MFNEKQRIADQCIHNPCAPAATKSITAANPATTASDPSVPTTPENAAQDDPSGSNATQKGKEKDGDQTKNQPPPADPPVDADCDVSVHGSNRKKRWWLFGGSVRKLSNDVFPGPLWPSVLANFLKLLSTKNLISDQSVTHHIVTSLRRYL